MKKTILFLLAVRATAYPICAKNIVPQDFAKKLLAHLKCIQKTQDNKKSFIKKY